MQAVAVAAHTQVEHLGQVVQVAVVMLVLLVEIIMVLLVQPTQEEAVVAVA